MSAAIIFIGFMGAGKSSAARGTASRLGVDPIDTDQLIAERIPGGSIAAYFRDQGEAAFRELERQVVLEAISTPGAVVALGGGAIETPEVRAALADRLTCWCRVEEEVAWERCAGGDRPLARDRDGFRRRFGARKPLYEEAARVVLPAGGEALGARVAPWLEAIRDRPAIRMIWAEAGGAEYPALIGPAATAAFEEVEELTKPGARRFAIADREALTAVGGLIPRTTGSPLKIKGGEAAKSFAAAGRTLEEMAKAGIRRDDAIVAFGGGVTGDLAGFCAAVYQRGIPVVQVPTTVVAQVDSAYGGKTGVDLAEAKNYVGAFHQPAAVLADPEALATLPKAEAAAGFAEIVKTALLAGGDLWERVRHLEAADPILLAPLVASCARTKLEIVAADEREQGLRAVLNLGHTVGHAIETVTEYRRYRHGEAISIGLLATLRLSGAEALREEVEALLSRSGLPTRLDPAIDPRDVVAATGMDKKQSADGLGFVLLARPGEPLHGQRVEADSLTAAVRELSA